MDISRAVSMGVWGASLVIAGLVVNFSGSLAWGIVAIGVVPAVLGLGYAGLKHADAGLKPASRVSKMDAVPLRKQP